MAERQEQLQSLIERLASLRVQGDIIRHQEHEALQELSLLITGSQLATEAVPIPVVATVVPQERTIDNATDLQPGDRVRITNSISNLVRGRQPTERDRICIVRRVTPARRVLITTETGINTWRYSANLRYSPRHDE